jgi:hypothetical protein
MPLRFLDAISNWQYREPMVEMSTLGYPERGPGRFPAEKPAHHGLLTSS